MKLNERQYTFMFIFSLMAIGLDQFKHLPYFHQLIRKFLLPCKSEEQIRVRIKNLTSSKAGPNIIKVFYSCLWKSMQYQHLL